MNVKDVKVLGGTISDEEINHYISYLEKKHTGLTALTIRVDGDFVDLDYRYADQPFERIRRITGYLVGTLDRFNDAKRAEEHDRVKHEL